VDWKKVCNKSNRRFAVPAYRIVTRGRIRSTGTLITPTVMMQGMIISPEKLSKYWRNMPHLRLYTKPVK
jgi:hypothetical protein